MLTPIITPRTVPCSPWDHATVYQLDLAHTSGGRTVNHHVGTYSSPEQASSRAREIGLVFANLTDYRSAIHAITDAWGDEN